MSQAAFNPHGGVLVTRRVLSSVLALLIVASGLVLAPRPATASVQLPPNGVRASTRARVAEHEAWLGRQVAYVSDFISGSSWSEIIHAAGAQSSVWKGDRHRAVYALSMFPPGGSFAAGNSGSYDDYIRQVAEKIVANDPDAVLRIGAEANGEFHPWKLSTDPAGYAAYFRRMVNIMRSVPGQQFEFEWSLVLKYGSPPTAAYPGDAYVDYVGFDLYDTSWAAQEADPVARWNYMLTYKTGLNWIDGFTAAHGKKLAFAEWGLSERHVAGVDPDNTYFLQKFHDWVAARSSRVGYMMYFDTDNHESHFRISSPTVFPKASALYRQLFGAGANVAPPSTVPPPAPTTTVPPATAPPTTKPPVTAPPTTKPPVTSPPTTKPPTTTPPTTTPPPSPPASYRQCTAPTNPAGAPSSASARGLWILDSAGRVFGMGVGSLGDLTTLGVTAAPVAIQSTASGKGYWIIDENNKVYAFGDAAHRGDPSGMALNADVVHMEPNGRGGYWMAAADGGVFAYAADFYGSMGGVKLDGEVIAMGSTPSGNGYWLVGSDGGVFAFGDAGFHGSTGGMSLDAPVVAMAADPLSRGYWLYAADGGVFSFGVPFMGSLPGLGLCATPSAVQLRVSDTGGGYWILDADGRVFSFGDARAFDYTKTLSPGAVAIDMAVAHR